MQRMPVDVRALKFPPLALAVTIALLIPIPAAALRRARVGTAVEPSRLRSGTRVNEQGSIALQQAILDISNPFSVLNLAVRPSEEDTGALVYCRRKLGMRTGVVFATSYSLTGCSEEHSKKVSDQAIEAAQSEDADTYFLNLPRAGPAQSKDALLSVWKHDTALTRLVDTIRDFKPDVITTTASSSSSDPESAALAGLLLEAIPAAADSAQSTSAKLTPWRVARVFALSATGEKSALDINLSEHDATRGASYLALAEDARRGYGAPVSIGSGVEHFNLVYPAPSDASNVPQTFLDGLTLPDDLAAALKPPKAGDAPMSQAITQREFLLDALVGTLVLRQVEGSEKNPHTEFGEQYFRLDRFTDRIQRAVTILLGLQLEVSLSSSVLVPGDRFSATLRLHNGSDKSFPVEFVLPSEIDLISDSSVNRSILSSIGQYGALNQTFEFKLPQSTPLTLPHPPVLDTLIHYSANDGWSNKSSFDAPRRRFIAEARVGLGPFILPVRAAFPYDVAERFEISASPSIALIQDWSASRDMNVTVRIVDHSAAPLSCELWVVQEALLNRDYEPARLTFVRKDEELLVPLRLQVPLLKPPLSTDLLLELRRAAPAPPDPLVSTTIKVKTAGVGAGRLRAVGYISGADRSPALALAELGADPVPLSIRDLEVAGPESKLVQLHAILIARDAYSRQPELKALNQRLLDFVSRGGTLIVGPQNPPAAVPPSGTVGPFPYQIKLSADPISVGSAAINEAHSELLSAPNKITAADLEAWPVGCPVNIPKEWDSHYKCLIKEGAPASEPGGLLLACDYGKGRLVYVGFDWQNALDEMTPGAYKLLANLLHGAEKSGKSESPSESPVYGPTD